MSYLKIANQAKGPLVDPVADDLSPLSLDILVESWFCPQRPQSAPDLCQQRSRSLTGVAFPLQASPMTFGELFLV